MTTGLMKYMTILTDLDHTVFFPKPLTKLCHDRSRLRKFRAALSSSATEKTRGLYITTVYCWAVHTCLNAVQLTRVTGCSKSNIITRQTSTSKDSCQHASSRVDMDFLCSGADYKHACRLLCWHASTYGKTFNKRRIVSNKRRTLEATKSCQNASQLRHIPNI